MIIMLRNIKVLIYSWDILRDHNKYKNYYIKILYEIYLLNHKHFKFNLNE